MANEPRTGAPYINSGVESVAGHNDGLNKISAFANLHVISRTTTAPPAAADGDAYIIPASATGDWSGIAVGTIAVWRTSAWDYVTPFNGMRAYVSDTNHFAMYRSSAWGCAPGEIVFSAYDATGETSVANSPTTTDLPFDNEAKKLAVAVTHAADAATITLKEAGTYDIDFECAVHSASEAADGQALIEGRLDAAAIPGALSYATYNQNDAGSSQARIRRIITVTANQVVKFRASRVAGSAAVTTSANTCRVTITRL